LFSNQEYLTGKGLGNLIALPLFLPAVQKGNSSFVDPKTMDPIADQIGYLKRARKMSLDLLDELYNERWTIAESNISNIDEKLKIILSNTINLSSHAIPLILINYLKEHLNFANSAFMIKKKSGRGTYETPRFFKLIEETENEILIPRGFIGKLLRFCRDAQVAHELFDKKSKHALISFL